MLSFKSTQNINVNETSLSVAESDRQELLWKQRGIKTQQCEEVFRKD